MIVEPDWSARSIGSAVPVEIRAHVGFVVMLQGSIEFELRACIARLLQVDADTLDIVTSELSYKQLMGLLSSLFLQRVPRDSDEYADFALACGKLDEFEAFRSSVAHCHWSHSLVDTAASAQAARHKASAKRGRGLNRVVEEVTVADMDLRLKKASFYLGELFALVQRVAARAA